MPTVEELFALVQQLQKQVAEQQKLIEHLQDANRRLLRWRFGQRTEKMVEGQCILALEGLTCPIDPHGPETDADAPVTTVMVGPLPTLTR